MKKQLLLASAMLCACSLAAQDVVEEVVIDGPISAAETPSSQFKSNWFVGAGAGPQVIFGDHDRQRKFGHRISPALDVFVGKWVTPSIGLRLMYSGLYAKGATQNGVFSTGVPLPGKGGWGYWLEKSKIDFMNLHFDIMFDLCNMIGGYKPDRFYSFIPYVGVGIAHTWNRPHNDAITGNIGFLNTFRIAKHFDINLDLRGTGFSDSFDGAEGNRSFDGLLSLTAGLTYRFGHQGWTGVREVVTVVDNDKVNALRAEVDALNRELANRPTETQTRVEVKQIASDYVVYFPIGVSALTNADKGQLEFVAKAIKSSGNNLTYYVTGYADKATGTAKINERLSRQRAENVRAYLINEFGIDGNRLKVDWKGGVGNMFLDDPALSRAVIISAE